MTFNCHVTLRYVTLRNVTLHYVTLRYVHRLLSTNIRRIRYVTLRAHCDSVFNHTAVYSCLSIVLYL